MASPIAGSPILPDEHDREDAVHRDGQDGGDGRRPRVVARVERAGQHGDRAVRGQPDEEQQQRVRGEALGGLVEPAVADQQLDDLRAAGPSRAS